MVTSNVALEFIKSKSKVLQKIVGLVFLLIGLFLLFQVLASFT